MSGDKDVEIRCTALLKSIIESGKYPPNEWKDILKVGLNTLFEVASGHQEKLRAIEEKRRS